MITYVLAVENHHNLYGILEIFLNYIYNLYVCIDIYIYLVFFFDILKRHEYTQSITSPVSVPSLLSLLQKPLPLHRTARVGLAPPVLRSAPAIQGGSIKMIRGEEKRGEEMSY